MSFVILMVSTAVTLSLAMALAFAIATRSGQDGFIDAIWSFAVGGAGAVAALLPASGLQGPTARQLVVAALAAVWSLRLGLHIARRAAGSGADPRYAQLRQDWGARFRERLFAFLQVQAAVGLLLVGCILITARNPSPHLGWGDGLGVLIMMVAVLGEGLADLQLSRFRADPRNKGHVCDIGLWGLSRHPNYVFECLAWFAYVPISLSGEANLATGWLALGGPVLMYWLLVHVSGVPPLEAHMLRSRGEEFRAYQARVSTFWPLPAPRDGLNTPRGRMP